MRIASSIMTFILLVAGVPATTAYAADDTTPTAPTIISCPPPLQWLCGK